MTQPPTSPTPPAGGPSPVAGGFAPPAGPPGYAYPVPAQPGPYSGLPGYPAGPPGGPYRGFPPVPLSPGGLPLAGFGDRLVAVLVDSLILSAVALVFAVPAFFAFLALATPELAGTGPDGTPTGDPFTGFLLPLLALEAGLFLVMLGLTYLYYVELTLRRGQTIGKRVAKVKIVPIDPTRALDRKALAKRWLAQHVGAALVPGLSYVDGLWQLWDKPHQQCLHDKFADTVVVKVAG
ncbi:RDD family protein [Micromonospora sp. NPDC000089]|uniref:RDD family protein n=1 Tax=unclassified Micromonospora TaxID=2617518 RepID=UPI0036885C7B